jgi:regulator of protease activity HflC (stomatin/prohibitin superfamily)
MSEEKINKPVSTELENGDAGMHALVQMLRVLFFCLRILIIVVFIYMLFSGMFRVDEQNQAMLFRFGSLQSRVLEPGQGETSILTSGRWYWAWPYPIDWVKVIPVQTSVTVTTDNLFMPWVNPQTGKSPESEGPAALKPGTDGYILTGDTNIMHSKWDVVYVVTDASRYYLDFYDDSDTVPEHGKRQRQRGAAATIRNLLANAVIQETATWTVEDLLANARVLEDGSVENIKDNVQGRLTELLDEVGIGVQVQSVNMLDMTAPSATSDAFEEVNASTEKGRAEILTARTYRDRTILAAEGHKYQIINEAKSYQSRVVESIKADSSYFETVLAEYNLNPATMLTALYTDALREVLGKVSNKYIVHRRPDGQQELRLQLSPVPEKDKPAAQQHQ